MDETKECDKNKISVDEYEVESITDWKVIDGVRYFKVHWKGYSVEDETWEPEKNLTNTHGALSKFLCNISSPLKNENGTRTDENIEIKIEKPPSPTPSASENINHSYGGSISNCDFEPEQDKSGSDPGPNSNAELTDIQMEMDDSVCDKSPPLPLEIPKIQIPALCKLCNRNFNGINNAVKHVRRVHQSISDPHSAVEATCMLCPYSYTNCMYQSTSSDSMRRHIMCVHFGIKQKRRKCKKIGRNAESQTKVQYGGYGNRESLYLAPKQKTPTSSATNAVDGHPPHISDDFDKNYLILTDDQIIHGIEADIITENLVELLANHSSGAQPIFAAQFFGQIHTSGDGIQIYTRTTNDGDPNQQIRHPLRGKLISSPPASPKELSTLSVSGDSDGGRETSATVPECLNASSTNNLSAGIIEREITIPNSAASMTEESLGSELAGPVNDETETISLVIID